MSYFWSVVPPKFETIMEDVDVHVGEMSRLAVVVEGKPDPDILWYKVEVLSFILTTHCDSFDCVII